ncbi:MAG: transglutaminase-like superfamily protein [Sporolactobacillus laevolacticus]|nr:transglutaminase-like superfamily protein [Sporolactobacillus laevolacticus]
MMLLKRVKKFMKCPLEMKGFYIEAFFFLGVARLLILLPFARINKQFGVEKMETSYSNIRLNKVQLKKIAHSVQLVSRHTPWKSLCFVQAIAAMKMLDRRAIESTLYFGTGKDRNGKLVAHAWLRSGDYYLTGAEVKHQFTVVEKFAKVQKKAL